MALKGVIFDHDGTLVDTERFHFQIWRDVIKRYDVDFSEQTYIEQYNGISSLGNAQLMVATYQLDISPEELCAIKSQVTKEYFDNIETVLMPFAEESIRACHQLKLKLAVATGASRQTLEHSISHRAFYPLFESVATSSDVEHGKPAPDVYLLALQELGLEIDECIAIEDSPTGIASAKAAGLRCIAVPNAYSKHQDLSAADYKVGNLEEATQLIQRLIKE